MAGRSGGDRERDYHRARPAAPDDSRALARPAGALAPAAPRGNWFLRLLRILLGFALLIVGVIGLFLPVLQGVLMILGGLALLSRDLPWARRLTDRAAAFVRRRSKARESGSDSFGAGSPGARHRA